MEAIETDLFICNPEKFSSIFRWHFWPRHGHLSLNIEQVRPGVVFQILTPIESRSRVGVSAAHDPMGPTIWDESAEFEAVEEISAEVVVHVDSVAEEKENCNIYVWSGLTHVLRAGDIG